METKVNYEVETEEEQGWTDPTKLVELARGAKDKVLWERDIEQSKRDEEARLQGAARLKANLKRCLGIEADPTELVHEVAGLKFTPHGHYRLDLIRPCAKCGQDAYDDVGDLAGLGFALDSQPLCNDWEAHRPPRPQVEEAKQITPLETLGQAFLDFIEANGYARPDYE